MVNKVLSVVSEEKEYFITDKLCGTDTFHVVHDSFSFFFVKDFGDCLHSETRFPYTRYFHSRK